jgi:hypothetical protein
VQLSVTNSLENALSFLSTGDVDIALVDATFGRPASVVSIVKIRELTITPTIVFTMTLTRDVDEQLRNLGADAVLSRDQLDPITLIETVQRVLEQSYHRKFSRPTTMSSGRAIGREVIVSDEAHECISAFKAWIVGADRLKQVLSERIILPENHRKKLRKLLCKHKDESGE